MNCSELAPGGNRCMGRRLCVVVLTLAGCLLCVPQARAAAPPPRLAIKAGTVYVGDGRTIENATILVEAGRIAAVGSDVSVPEGTPIIQVEGGTITPGLIDANARVESVDLIAPSRRQTAEQGDLRTSAAATVSGLQRHALGNYGQGPAGRTDTDDVIAEEEQSDSYPMFDEGPPEDLSGFAVGVLPGAVINEQASEVVPYIRVLDALDLRSPDWERLLRGGVTTVYASPDASAVIGARGAVLHTGGAADQRVLCPAAAVKAVIGTDPSILGTYNRRPSGSSVDMYARRPNSRMGVTWVFRKAFYDAERRGRGVEAYGADTASPEASAVLREVRAGKIPLRIQARIQQDILTALRLAKEFDLRFTLEEATEAYRCLDELQQASVPVVFGPIYERPDGIRLRSGEAERSRYYTFRALLERGIKTALSAQEFREEDGLARQAMYAVRFGAGFDDALRAVTQTPAQLLGLDDQLGTVEVGKRADLVLWSGRPFAATSAVTVVLIDGRVVVDRR